MKKSALFSEASPLAFFRKGFTLIELVVVISIIAILSTIALFGFSKAQASGRDASRGATMNSFRSALERFYSDNQYYPKTQTAPLPDGGDFGKMAAILNSGGYLTTTAITDPSKGCTNEVNPPATGNWDPCTGKAPTYVYDSSTTAYAPATCGYVGTTLTTTGCKAECSVSGACYSLFLFNEATSTVTIYKSPQ